MKININSYIPVTDVEGIGTRFAIWVQGCSIKCPGCANSYMWDAKSGTEYDTKDFFEIIKKYKNKIEGITWLGGEPTDQIKAVIEISKAVQDLGLSVILFTGHEYEEIKENTDFIELLKYTDILIDGEYDKNKRDFSRAWVGSSNQNYYFISNRYNETEVSKCKNKIEMRITPDNRIVLTGMGDYKQLAEMMG